MRSTRPARAASRANGSPCTRRGYRPARRIAAPAARAQRPQHQQWFRALGLKAAENAQRPRRIARCVPPRRAAIRRTGRCRRCRPRPRPRSPWRRAATASPACRSPGARPAGCLHCARPAVPAHPAPPSVRPPQSASAAIAAAARAPPARSATRRRVAAAPAPTPSPASRARVCSAMISTSRSSPAAWNSCSSTAAPAMPGLPPGMRISSIRRARTVTAIAPPGGRRPRPRRLRSMKNTSRSVNASARARARMASVASAHQQRLVTRYQVHRQQPLGELGVQALERELHGAGTCAIAGRVAARCCAPSRRYLKLSGSLRHSDLRCGHGDTVRAHHQRRVAGHHRLPGRAALPHSAISTRARPPTS